MCYLSKVKNIIFYVKHLVISVINLLLLSLVGGPISTPKIENPSQKEIDELHAKYLAALRELYDKYNPVYGDPKVGLNFI